MGGIPEVALPPRTQRALAKLMERLPADKRLRDLIHTLAEFGE